MPEITDQTVTQVTQQVQDDIELAKKATALVAKKDFAGLVALAIENESKIKQQVQEVEQVIPAIKSGWKTSEFWLIAIFLVTNVVFALKGMTFPLGDDITVGSLVAGYAASRHAIKTK
jgi:hypothetical protein